MQVQLHHAGDVSAVYGREDAFGACQPAQLLCRQHDTRNRGDMAKEHYARPRSNGVTEKVQNLCRVLNLFRSEEHTSELQSLTNLVCRLLLEKKKTQKTNT